ncbi:Hypothetical protein KVN_LOCUS401 [uncultured virus]|nr:Hypothetical protein KVN_LOCUS401 [uncultured virus]
MPIEFKKIRYKNKFYAVIKLKIKKTSLPVVIDWEIFYKIKNILKSLKYHKNSFVSCIFNSNNSIKKIFLHKIVKFCHQKEYDSKISLLHINRIGLDNRMENLIFDKKNKEIFKNVKKKKRIIILPQNCGFTVDEIPTFVSYLKANKQHGDRFMVKIADIIWKTTSSKKLSLKFKLEQAKLFLKKLKLKSPFLFENYSMNGDFTKTAARLIKSYYEIIYKAGYNHICKYNLVNNTKRLLKCNLKTRQEKILLKKKNIKFIRSIPNLPNLPKYCYYYPKKLTRSDYFVIKNHPNQNKKVWYSSSSKKISISEKFNKMIEHLNLLNNQ